MGIDSITSHSPSESVGGRPPLKVFLTVDVELWPRSWDGYREEFPQSFRRFILGETRRGDVGLPFQLRMANDHGLRFTFLVESLFSWEFGIEPLRDIVNLIHDAGQNTELHAHPEWMTHSSKPIVETGGRYLFSQFTLEEQYRLIETAMAQLKQAGAPMMKAFRAGSFAANVDTLAAVARAGLKIDSSFKLGSALAARPISEYRASADSGTLLEYPLSTYKDWPGRTRHLQLTACTFDEMVFVMENAYRLGWEAVVLLSHSAELLNRERSLPDKIVVRRFEKLCRWLADRRNQYVTLDFGRVDTAVGVGTVPSPIRSNPCRTLRRMGEQAMRRWNG